MMFARTRLWDSEQPLKGFNEALPQRQVLFAADRTPIKADRNSGGKVRSRIGGERGIRTPDTVPRIHAFEACGFNHSPISPLRSGARVVGGLPVYNCGHFSSAGLVELF